MTETAAQFTARRQRDRIVGRKARINRANAQIASTARELVRQHFDEQRGPASCMAALARAIREADDA